MEQFVNAVPIWAVVVLLVVGFVLLIKGADCFVDGSSSVAKRFHVPSIIIGLTIVAMGTSLPELSVSVSAAIIGNNELAVSNVVGSNIFNLMVVIGVCGVLKSITVAKQTITKDIPLSIVCAVLLAVLGGLAIGDASGMTIGRIDGIVLLIIFVCYIASMIRQVKNVKKENNAVDATAKDKDAGNEAIEEFTEAAEEVDEIKVLSPLKSFLFIILGIAAIVIGGDLTVDSASRIATELGMSQTLIGLTIVSIGTSLPELVTSIVAAHKDEVDLALGNAVGSNIFNILMILGVAAVISPMGLITENLIDIAVLVAFSLIVWLFSATKKRIGKAEGLIMILLYAVYAVYICIR